MSAIHNRPGVHEACLVKRHLKLQHLDHGLARAITEEIALHSGVDTVELDSDSRRLDVTYDASQLQFPELTDILLRHGVEPERGWWARFRASWYRFTDQNIRDNARHEPHCCNKAPPGK
jgi:hypothetical protein